MHIMYKFDVAVLYFGMGVLVKEEDVPRYGPRRRLLLGGY